MPKKTGERENGLFKFCLSFTKFLKPLKKTRNLLTFVV